MHPDIAIIYNKPAPSRYTASDEDAAIKGVLNAVAAVENALLELSCQSFLVPLSPPLDEALDTVSRIKASVIFNLFEGFDGQPETEVEIAKGCHNLNIPYTGNPPEALEIGLDKVLSKNTFKKKGIPTPDFQILDSSSPGELTINYPVIAKPSQEDASHGIYIDNVIYSPESLNSVLERILLTSGKPALVEEFIDGKEFNATVLGNKVLPVSEIVYDLPSEMPRILTFESKWNPDSLYYKQTQSVCPAKTSRRDESKIRELSINAYKACGCHGYSRVDIRQDDYGSFYVLEVNPNPDISPDAGCAKQAAAAGLTYTELIKIIIEQALDNS